MYRGEEFLFLASSSGFILGLIGGLLDFASASLLVLNPGPTSGTTMMDTSAVSADAWAVLLVVLGIAVIVTSVLSVQTVGVRLGRVFSVLMMVYGVIMLAIGISMTTGYIPAGGISLIYSYGMILVGGAMVANGVVVSRSPMHM
jgi:hypothetical protein